MKTLLSVLLPFLVVCQLHAQNDLAAGLLTSEMNILRDSNVAPLHVVVERITMQPALRVDILDLAKSSAYEKDFEKADRLLYGYSIDHSEPDVLSFHAHVLYWMKSFDRSAEVYKKALRLHPQPSSIYLDYARLCYSLKQFTTARRLLSVYRAYDSANAEAAIMIAYINLWNGKIALAEKGAGLLLQKYPGNADAKEIMSKVNNYTTPYIKTAVDVLADDQPVKGKALHVEAGAYKSWLFAPTLQAGLCQFQAADSSFQSTWMQVANTLQLRTEYTIKLKGGLFQQNGKGSAITGGLEYVQKFKKYFLLQAALERRPYQFSVASLQNVVMEDLSTVSISYNKNKWFGKAAYELLKYKDANRIHTAYLWVLAPVISKKRYSISGGYAFRYADAVTNSFVSKRPVSEVAASPSSNGVPGIYSPYFTPENQVVHAALAAVKFVPFKKVEFSSRISLGLSAKADNPYLWLGKSGNEFTIEKGYLQTRFLHANWVSDLNVSASDKLSIAASYSYDKLLYYTSHKGSIGLKYLFIR